MVTNFKQDHQYTYLLWDIIDKNHPISFKYYALPGIDTCNTQKDTLHKIVNP